MLGCSWTPARGPQRSWAGRAAPRRWRRARRADRVCGGRRGGRPWAAGGASMTGVAATTGLSTEQVEHFHTEGYLVVEGVLDAERDIAPVMREYAAVLDGIARELHAAGEIGSTYADLDFDARLIRVCEESGRNFPQHFDFSLPQTGVKHDTPIHVGPAVFGLLTNPRLLDVAESLLGPEVYSNPVQHIRMKLPHRAVTKQGDFNGLVSRVP